MALQFLNLTNKVLVRLNEVPLTEAGFASATGFYSDAQNAVNLALKDVNTQQYEWPFNHQYATQQLVRGTQIYALPLDTHSVDWDTFYIARDDGQNIEARHLSYMDYDRWASIWRDIDFASDELAWTVPTNVFPTQGLEFGVSGVPGKDMTCKFEYWKVPADLQAYNDVATVPDAFEHVLINGAMFYAYLFRENIESAALMEKLFRDGIENMRRILVPQPSRVSDTRAFRRR